MPGEEVTIKQITRVSGGTGGNVAVAAARILGAKEVAMIGALGEDDIARQQIITLNAEGVITEGVNQIPEEESGQAYILVDQKGQNIIASRLGANARLSLEHLYKPQIKSYLQHCRSIVLTDPPLEVAIELLNLAKQRGIPVLWDPGILISPESGALLPLVKQANILFLNEVEATTLLAATELNMILQRLQEMESHNYTVLKLGAQGAAMLEPATGMVVEIPSLPLKDLGLNAINTVGCGDAFVGAFAAYRVLDASIRESLIMATVAAGLNASKPETRGCPNRATLEEVVQHSHNLGFMARAYRLSEDC